MSLTAAELKAVYTVDEGPLDRSLGGLGGKVKGAVGGAVAAAAGLFAFGEIKDGFLSFTGAASDLNETINKSSVIFGANAAAMDDWSKGAATNLGLSRQQALNAAAGFGDMFSQIGFAGDKAADMSRQVVQMSADLGSFNNLDTADVADRMSAAFRGEFDSLQALIPNINAARVESEALAMTGKENAEALTAQEKAAAVLAIVQKDGARAMGDFAKTSDGAANSAKIATAEWEDQKAAIGQDLLPALTAMIGFVRSTVIPGVGALASFIKDDAIPAIRDMAQWIDANKGPIMVVAGVIAAVFLPHLIALGVQSLRTKAIVVGAWIAKQAAAIGAAIVHSAQIAWMIVRFVALSAAAVLNAGLTVGAWIGMGVAAVAQAAIVAAAWLGAQVRTVASLVVMAAGFVAQGAVMVASTAVTVASVVAGWVLMGAQALIQAARMAAAWFIALGPVGWVIAAVIGLVALIVANWDTVVRWTRQAWEWVVGAVKSAVQFMVNAFLNFTLPGLIIKHWDTIKSAFSNGVSAAVGFVRELPGRAAAALGNLGSLLVGAGGDLIRGFINGIKSAFGRVRDTLSNLTSMLPDWKGPAARDATILRNAGRLVMGGFEAGLVSKFGDVRRTLGDFTGQLQAATAPEMLRLADTQALAGLTVRPPAVAARPAVPAAAGAAGGVGGAGAAGGGIGELIHIDNYHEAPGSSPQQNAQALAIEWRTRGV
ncbi:phage tail protein [Blastococcus mobilis]|uniref:Phage-related protein n=1 Tax=Blastococcus mobilis TaxID=1938746 RepID=A0A238VGE1_9ACTN|nr:hypothetical protein [Blastococcus mobilis]SNR33137.1 hypothetical protein SAMN06272737_10395 [Blastococcus mobilis]